MSQVLIQPRRDLSRWLKPVVLPALGLGLAALFLILAFFWPFRLDTVTKELADESDSKVTAGSFRATYFPHPGCVLEQVIFQHNLKSRTPPLIIVKRITIRGTFTGIFARHVKLVLVEGMHILIPPLGGEHFKTPRRSSVVIDDLVADGTVLEVASRDSGTPPLQFSFRGFDISNVGSDSPAVFKATLANPEPPGEITTTGRFGPWNPDEVGKTAVSGDYRFEHADLGVFRGISGILGSSGKYTGRLEHIDVQGSTDVPLFAVTRSSHQVPLRTQFHAVVNAENGDVLLQGVRANLRQTTIGTQGSVAGEAGHTGKTTSLTMASRDGRIQDLLLLFTSSPQAPMSGIVSFNARISLPPGEESFLKKVELQGDFGIDAGSFTKSDTQRGVNSLSQGAQGNKNPKAEDDATRQNALSDLRGHVLLRHGIATLSNLSFGVPGALAQMRGTYNLITEKIDLHGTLKTQAEVSKTTHGIKSLMLKVLDPFFKNKPDGYLAPVKITGTYDHPMFGLDLGDPRKNNNQHAKVHNPGLPDQAKQ
jgi:AsmA-like C-terminal region